MRVHIIRGAKPIKNRNFQGNWLYLRDEIFEPLRKAEKLSIENFKIEFFDYKLTSSYPLFFSDASANASLIIHESVTPIFKNFNIQQYALFPIEVNMKEQMLKYYYFNYQGYLDENDIDFTKSSFASYKGAKQIQEGIKFADYQEFLKTKKDYQEQRSQESFRIHKLIFKNSQHNKLDFFYLNNPENRMVISDRMYNSILGLGHKRLGLEFMDFLTVHVGEIGESNSSTRTTIKEVSEPLDFGNLTNLSIEARILKNHQKLKTYFDHFDIQNEVETNSFVIDKKIKDGFLKTYNSKLDQIFNLFHAAPLASLVASAKIYFEKVNKLIEEKNLNSEIIILGTSFENHCFYTDHLIHGEENSQMDIGELSFYLSYDSDNNIPFEELPYLDILSGEEWWEITEEYNSLPFIDNLIELHYNALRMMFYKTFQIATKDIKTKPVALSLEYYDKEDLDFICL